MNWRARLRRGFRRGADWFPWTPLGLLVGALSAYVLFKFAPEEMDIVLQALGYGTVGLLAVSTAFVFAGAAIIKLSLQAPQRDEPLRLETRRPHLTGFALRSLSWLPMVQVRWEWEAPDEFEVGSNSEQGRHLEQVTARRRGEYKFVRRRILIQDAFGLARLGLRLEDNGHLEVYPDVGAFGRMPVLVSMSGGEDFPHPMGLEDGDRVDLRRYAPGDPARFIHWKVYSRTRKLMVRVPERALTRSTRTVAYLVAGAEDDATAGAARAAIQSRAFGDDWLFGADGGSATKRIGEALTAIMRSVEHRDRGGRGLESFLREAESTGPSSSVVFVPPRPGPWLDYVAKSLTARRGRSKVVIGVDGLRTLDQRALWRRALVRPPEGLDTPVEPLEEVLQALAKLRLDVVLLDRKKGRVLGEKHRAAARRRAA